MTDLQRETWQAIANNPQIYGERMSLVSLCWLNHIDDRLVETILGGK